MIAAVHPAIKQELTTVPEEIYSFEINLQDEWIKFNGSNTKFPLSDDVLEKTRIAVQSYVVT